MDLFANLRPAVTFDALLDASALKPEILQGLDMIIVRESTSGVYFGQPRGIETQPDGKRRAFDTQVYTEDDISRVAAVAFELARRSEEHTSELQSLMRSSYAVFFLRKNKYS